MKRLIYTNILPEQTIQQLVNRSLRRVITPTQQAARVLKVPHSSLENLAQKTLAENGIRVAPRLKASRCLRLAVSEIIPTSDIEGTTRVLTPAIQAILRAGVNLEALAAVDSARTRQLAHLADAYTNLLRAEGMVDSASVLWEASRMVTKRQPLLIYGYFQPRIEQLNFLDAIAHDGSILVLPCLSSGAFKDIQAAIDWLKQQNWQVQEFQENCQSLSKQLVESFLQGTDPPVGVEARVYPHLELEVRGVLAQVKNLLNQGTPANEIVLVARDDAFYGATVLDVANEYNLPVCALYAVPLAETRLGAWVQLLLEVIQRKFSFESTAKLLSHPLCTGLSASAWIQARQQHPSNLWAWQNIDVNLSLLDWPPQDNRANWVERLQVVLKKFDVRRRAGRWAREILAYYEFQTGLVELAKPEVNVISFEEFSQDILGSLALLTVPAQPGRGGVELHTPLSLFGTKFQHVFVLGTSEGMLPAPVQDDPMLDFSERKQLVQQGFNLEDAAQAARREGISFYALLQTPREQITFSYPQMIGSQASLPSPYLARLGLKPIASPPLLIASLQEARRIYLRRDSLLEDAVLPYAIHALAVEKRREGFEPYDEYDGVVGIPLDPKTRLFSASQLTTLGQCPFKWFADKVLRLAELEEAEEDLSPGLKGQLYHRSLELVLAKVFGAADIGLEAAFIQAEQDLQLPTIPAWEAQRAEHIKVLSRTLEHSEFLPPDAEIVSLEKSFRGEWYGLEVTGRIDRIDRTPEGLVLLDYKTGAQKPPGIKNENSQADVDIQMPLYTHIARTILFPDETVKGSDYYLLTKRQRLTNKPLSVEEQQQIAEKLKTHLEKGHYPVDPDSEGKACRFCAYDLVCRQGTRQSRKEV
jgi:CRISPR/Cas system-associated exonuclease Cas4 (RecB family)